MKKLIYRWMKEGTADIVAHREEFANGFAMNNWRRMSLYGNDHWCSRDPSFGSATVGIRTTSTSASQVEFTMWMNKQTTISKAAVRKCPINRERLCKTIFTTE